MIFSHENDWIDIQRGAVMTIPEFSIKRWITVFMVVLIITIFGIIAFSRLGLDMLPELEYPVVSVITTFIGIYLFDYTLNIMTLGGLALAVGMPVDDAIVVIENTFRHLDEEGEDRVTAAKRGAEEVAMAITASTLTTVVVFLPMVLSTGIAGRLSRPLAVTVTLALFASLFVSLTIFPVLASLLFRKRPAAEGGNAPAEDAEAFTRHFGRARSMAWPPPSNRWAIPS